MPGQYQWSFHTQTNTSGGVQRNLFRMPQPKKATPQKRLLSCSTVYMLHIALALLEGSISCLGYQQALLRATLSQPLDLY